MPRTTSPIVEPRRPSGLRDPGGARRPPEVSTGSGNPDRILDILATVVESPDFETTLGEFLEALAALEGVERASLGEVQRGRVQLLGVSGGRDPGPRTELAEILQAAMEECLDARTITSAPTAPGGSAIAGVTREHERLRERGGCEAALSVPVELPDGRLAIVTLEGESSITGDDTGLLIESALRLAAPCLFLRRSDEQTLARKALVTLRRTGERLFGPGHLISKVVCLGALLVVLGMTFIEGDHSIPARSILEGSVKRAAVAPFDGFVREAPRRAGDLVEEGDLLCLLDDRDLRLERLKWESQRQQIRREHQKALAEGDAAEIRILEARLDQVTSELSSIEFRLERARIVSPLGGVVVSGDLSQSIGAPVQRGDLLFEVAPLDEYRLVLEVDDRDIEEIEVGRTGHLALSALPSNRMAFTVSGITPVSISRDGRNFFRVEARLDGTPHPRLRPGMEGVSRVLVGRRRLIWIWTREIVEALSLGAWSWLP